MIDEDEFDQAQDLAFEIFDFSDVNSDNVSAMACLMAASIYLVSMDFGSGRAGRLLRVLMDDYKKNAEKQENEVMQ